jgi:superfamily I DNA and/or RNA helicase
MRELLKSNGIRDVKIGSVEEFQGQERMVMILSTVRVMAMEDDSMGFISNPNRINVALTRARALLIVIGDPHLLNTDRNWGVVLRDCIKRNAYVGCDVPIGKAKRPLSGFSQW